jgi:hypothetical protein
MQEIEIDGSKAFLLPVIKGPVSEAEKVRSAITDGRPTVVGISVSKEELEGLRAYKGEEIELSELEEAYRLGLEEFGEVKLPPPCYLEAVKACDELQIPLIPIDMNEELFSDRYCELIGGLELMRESFFARRLAKKRFDMDSAESFVLDYDRKVNGGRGLSTLNREREVHMATTVLEMAPGRATMLVIVELERFAGLIDKISMA